MSHQIRPIALAIIRRGDDILVFEARDEAKDETFYRPLGGGINFGERAVDAVQRELREELGVDLTNLRYIATLENIFVANHTPGHEYAVLFAADVADPAFYAQDAYIAHEDNGDDVPVRWMPLAAFQGEGAPPLYPDGLLALLLGLA